MKKASLNLDSQSTFFISNTKSFSILVLDSIGQRLLGGKDPLSQSNMLIEKRLKDRPMLGFLDHKNMDKTLNVTLQLIVTTTIANHLSCEDKSILAFSDSSTQPCEMIDLHVSFCRGEDKRIVDIVFFVVLCESIYNDILERSFLTMLDVVAFLVHLMMKFHNDAGQSILVKADMCGALLIYEATLKNSLEFFIALGKMREKVDKVTSVVNLDVQEE
ncbi:unnamed protein product [Vicia faba]|uniref:Coatomer subunit zeta n=1 Tax=Vicia faba TaxID=3906 RepID=A0AAV1B1F7_VICFA|nr:unnamed protein product [Vicia faba]